MFKNCGKKIQGISAFLFLVGILATIVLAGVFSKDNWGDFNFLSFLAILASGGLSVYVVTLFLNGFGIIVENNELQKAVIEKQNRENKSDEGKDVLVE